jgi:WXG100 family type VII secretion target
VVAEIAGDFRAFAEAEDAFQRVRDGLQGDLSQLDRELSAALAQWSDDAAEAYRVTYSQWHQAARDMAGRLAGLRTVIVVSDHDFRAAQRAGLRMWRRR